MRVFTFLPVRICLSLLVSTLALSTLSGCGGGGSSSFVQPTSPTLAFATIPSQTFGAAPFQVTASSASTGAVTYSLTPGQTSAGTVSSSGLVTLTGVGTVYLTANQAANGNYLAATATTSFTVSPGVPTLTFAAIPAQTFGNAPFQVTASSASNGAVTYSLTAGQTSAGTVSSSGLVTITGAGTIYLTASQAASGNYLAVSATTSLNVAPAVPTLTFAAIPAETFGNAPFQVTAASVSSGAVTYSLTQGQTSAGTVSSSGLVTITGAGTIYLTATQAASGNYAASTASASFNVAQEIPTLTFAVIPSETFGNAPFQVTASSASSGTVTYSLTPGQTSAGTVSSSGLVTLTGSGTVYLTATQAASGNYATATATTSFTVAQEVPTLTFATIPSETFGNAPFQVTASSPSSGAVTYSLTPGQTSAGTVTSSGLVTITGVGTIYLTATQAASGSYLATTATTSFAVALGIPTLTFATIPAETFGNAPFQVTASSASSGTITYSLTAGQTSAGTVTSSGLVTITGAGTVYLTATQAASGNYTTTTATTSFTVAQEAPTLTFAAIPPETFGNAPFQVTASSASGGAVTYSLTPGQTSAGTVSSSGLVTITGAGTIYLTATQAASSNYTTTTVTTSFAVAQELPTLTFAAIPSEAFGNTPFQVTASSASNGAVTYSLTPGQTSAGTVSSSGLVTLTGAGTVYLTATQAASGNYLAATVTTSFAVALGVPTVTFAAIPAETFGNPPFQVTASSASSGAITYSLTPGQTSAGTVSSSGLVTMTGAGTIYLTATQAANGNYTTTTATTSFTVAQETLTLTFAPIPPETFGNAPFQVTASSLSSGAVTYSLTPGQISAGTVSSSGLVTITGAGTIYLTANQAASGNYAAGTATTSFAVAQEVPTLTFATIPSETFGNAPFQVTASSVSSGAVTYSLTAGQTSAGTVSSSGLVTITGAGTIYLTATQAAGGNYATATATTSFAVAKEVPTLTFAVIPPETFGNAPFQVTASSASSGAVTYSLTTGQTSSGTVSSSGLVTITGAGTIYLTATQAASGNYLTTTATTSFAVAQEVPTLTFATVPSETFGNAPFQVTASSASSGAVTYSLTAGQTSAGTVSSSGLVTITGAGTIYLTATQAASGNYAVGTATTSFTVAQEVPTLTFATVPSETFGNAPFQVTASSASSGAVTYSLTAGQTSAGTVSSSGLVTITGAGTIYLTATQAASGNYAAGTATTSIVVAQELPTLTFATIPPETFGDAPFQVTASSASSGAVTYSLTAGQTSSGTVSSAGLVTITGAGTIYLTATQAASGNYLAATATTSFTVAQEVPTLTFATIPAEAFGNAPFQVTASSASSGAVTYSLTAGQTSVGTVTSGGLVTLTGVGTVYLTANQAASGNYAAGTATTSFAVALGVPALAFATIPPQIFGNPPFQVTASSASSGAVTYSLTSGQTSTGTVTSSGVVTLTGIGTVYLTATQAAAGNYTTAAATTSFGVYGAPLITVQPVSKNVCAGYNPSFSISATNTTTYQWYFGASPVGTNSPTLTLTGATAANDGTYSCKASNVAGSTTSNTVALNVVTPTTPAIAKNPSSVSVYATQTANFSVSATGTGTLSYQWYTGTPGSGTPISGATASNFTTGALATTDSGTTYYVTVIDGDCTNSILTSTAATVTVTATDTAVPPTIVTQPASQIASIGGTATYAVIASGSGTLTYQWYQVPFSATQRTTPTAGVAISGATNSSYTVPTTATAQSDDGDSYFVIVSNAYGSAESVLASLTVGNGIAFQLNGQPQTVSVPVNSLATFSVAATCGGCIPAYKWYLANPGTATFTALTDGAVSTGNLSGATVSGSATSSLTLQNLPATASGSIVYAVVTSTSDGSTLTVGTNPLTSNTAGLFVGSLTAIGNPAAGEGLCNYNSVNWTTTGVIYGSPSGGTVSGDVPYQDTVGCTIQLSTNGGFEASTAFWPVLIPTTSFSVSFTATLSLYTAGSTGDGFTMILADPSQGATTASLGMPGEGLGAAGVPGTVIALDTFQDGNDDLGPLENSCAQNLSNGACDPTTVPYIAVGQSATSLWENPWTYVNGYLNTQSSADYAVADLTTGSVSHAYVVTVNNSVMTVTMDGYQIFNGTVSLPPVAYLGFTGGTGGDTESAIISSLNATVSAP